MVPRRETLGTGLEPQAVIWSAIEGDIFEKKRLSQTKTAGEKIVQVGKKTEQVLSSSQMLSLTLKKCSISFCQPKKNYAQPEAEKKIPCPRKLPKKKHLADVF